MSHVIATPEIMTATAADLATIGSMIDEAHRAAAAATGAVIPAAADEVSMSIAHLFSAHARDYHAVASRAAAFQQQFVQNLKASAVSYASVEDAIASFLQGLTASAESFVNTVGDWLAQQEETSPLVFTLLSILGGVGYFGFIIAATLIGLLIYQLQQLLGYFGL